MADDATNDRKSDSTQEDITLPSTEVRSFRDVADLFVSNLEAMHSTFPLVAIFVKHAEGGIRQQFELLRDNHGEVLGEEDGIQQISFDVRHSKLAGELLDQILNLSRTQRILPQNFILSLVSEFDAFLSQLIGMMFRTRPELLDATEKKFSFSEIASFNDLESARQYLIEKEAENVMRDSHTKQFDWLERKLGIPLRKDLVAWPTFIEVTERRNLFSHTGGIISSQYLAVCKTHGVTGIEDVRVGQKIATDLEYFKRSFETVFEVGVKLAHVVWRKMIPNERESADSNLNSVAYKLLKRKQFELAKTILDFAVNIIPKHSTDRARRIFVINLAQAHKGLGDTKMADQIISSEDWTACGVDFELCVAVLKGNFEGAANLMKTIGANGQIDRMAYADWPIFSEFRTSDQFQNAYREIFDEDFVVSTDFNKADKSERPK